MSSKILGSNKCVGRLRGSGGPWGLLGPNGPCGPHRSHEPSRKTFNLLYIWKHSVEPDFTVSRMKANLVNLSNHCTVHLELSAARDTNIVEHKIVCLPILSLYIIHSHQQPESRFFVKPMWLAPYSPNCSLD